MIDPHSPEYARWAEVQARLAEQCAQWRDEIRELRAKRARIDGAQRASLMSHDKQQGYVTRAKLVMYFENSGPQMRTWSRSATRDQLAERVIEDRLKSIDADITRLETLIAENQPSPFWKKG